MSGGEAGEGGQTLLEMVNENAAAISTLQGETLTDVTSGNDALLARTKNGRTVTLTPVTCNIADVTADKDGFVLASDAKTYIENSISDAIAWEDVQ